ncbi:MAG: Hsp20/alpha crystallin family protein [Desulfobacterales bacterium]|nr:Hsp20/alpha crystallin family protein [Desulfobacterales bacterium]
MMIRGLFNFPTLSVRGPFEELELMKRQMERLSDELTGGFYKSAAGVFPLINVAEDKDAYHVSAELPGLLGGDLDISTTANTLTISGERKIPSEGENVKYHRREREAGKFSRVIGLPGQINTEKVEANCIDGILKVTLPKHESTKPRQIPVR